MATYWENSCSFGLRYVSWYKYLIVGLVFSRLGFWSGNLFLIAPFPDLCLLVPFQSSRDNVMITKPVGGINIYLSLSLYTAIRPRGHSRRGCAWSVSIRQFKIMKI